MTTGNRLLSLSKEMEGRLPDIFSVYLQYLVGCIMPPHQRNLPLDNVLVIALGEMKDGFRVCSKFR